MPLVLTWGMVVGWVGLGVKTNRERLLNAATRASASETAVFCQEKCQRMRSRAWLGGTLVAIFRSESHRVGRLARLP